MRLPRNSTLASRTRIREILQKGPRRSAPGLTVFFVPPKSADAPHEKPGFRYAILVPTRSGGAVYRNRLRRVLREEIRLWPGRATMAGECIVRYNPPSPRRLLAPAEQKNLRARLGQLLNEITQS